MEDKKHKLLRRAAIIFSWLALWQIISILVNNSILITGPAETLQALFTKAFLPDFWKTVLYSLLRIGAGFFSGLAVGVVLAALSAGFKPAEELISPVISLLKAVPVASFVVLFLIWWHSQFLAVAVSFCVVMPNIYVNTLEGIKSTDRKLLEMAKVYRMPLWNKFFYIYRPALKPFLDSSIKISAGMSWKSGVAAEIIGTPEFSIGEQLYMSKIHLDTAGVLAWTGAVVALSILFEKAVLYLWESFLSWESKCRPAIIRQSRTQDNTVLRIKNISKAFGDNLVISDYSAEYERGEIYYFSAPSGSGKTTLFRIIAGLEKPDAGIIEKNLESLAMVFQEDRLCEEYSAVKNVEMVTGSKLLAEKYLKDLLSEDEMNKPCRYLSGGMKRRAAIARAFAAVSDIIILDEPFTGLDKENRDRVNNYIKKYGKNSAVLVATHIS